MNNTFYMPTKIILGENCLNNNKYLLEPLGNKALLVTGKHSSKANGSLNDVKNILKDLDVEYYLYDEVEENPSLDTINKISNLGKLKNVDFVIGIGGGSPLDASKAAAVLINNTDATITDLGNNPSLSAVPVIAIPTTAGTGSETTPYSIVTDHNLKTKRGICQKVFPIMSFLDPSYLINIPISIRVNTGIDALSHLIEGYLSSNANILSDSLAEKGLEYFGDCIYYLQSEKLNLKQCEKLLVASTIAGMVISQAGTSLPHGMGYALTYYKNIPHGKANGLLLKEYLNFCSDKLKVNKILSLLKFNNLDDFGTFLDKLFDEKISLSEKEIIEYSYSMVGNTLKLKNHPTKVTVEDIATIYKSVL